MFSTSGPKSSAISWPVSTCDSVYTSGAKLPMMSAPLTRSAP